MAEAGEAVCQGKARSDPVRVGVHDPAAFAALVDRYYASLLRYLTRQTGDAELAADLTQATFLAAFRCRHQLADEAAVGAWLFGIARNQLRMEWRRRRRRRFVSLDWLAPRREGTSSGAGPTLEAPALRADDASGPCAERDRIQRVLDQLGPTLREALLLHSLCGFSGGELAAIVGISPDAARKRIARAEAAFRERYRAAEAQDGVDDDARR